MGQERRLLTGAVQRGEALGDGEESGKLRGRIVVRKEEAPAQEAGQNVGIGGSGGLHVSSPESRRLLFRSVDPETPGYMAVSQETAPGAKSPVRTARSEW